MSWGAGGEMRAGGGLVWRNDKGRVMENEKGGEKERTTET